MLLALLALLAIIFICGGIFVSKLLFILLVFVIIAALIGL